MKMYEYLNATQLSVYHRLQNLVHEKCDWMVVKFPEPILFLKTKIEYIIVNILPLDDYSIECSDIETKEIKYVTYPKYIRWITLQKYEDDILKDMRESDMSLLDIDKLREYVSKTVWKFLPPFMKTILENSRVAIEKRIPRIYLEWILFNIGRGIEEKTWINLRSDWWQLHPVNIKVVWVDDDEVYLVITDIARQIGRFIEKNEVHLNSITKK